MYKVKLMIQSINFILNLNPKKKVAINIPTYWNVLKISRAGIRIYCQWIDGIEESETEFRVLRCSAMVRYEYRTIHHS